eukprot:gene6670-6894_t
MSHIVQHCGKRLAAANARPSKSSSSSSSTSIEDAGDEQAAASLTPSQRQTVLVSATLWAGGLVRFKDWCLDPVFVTMGGAAPTLSPEVDAGDGVTDVDAGDSKTWGWGAKGWEGPASVVQQGPKTQGMAGGAEGAALVPTLPPNLEHRYLVASAAHRADAMRRALYALGIEGMALGFMNWQQRLKDVAAKMEAKKITVGQLHGEMSALDRAAVLEGARRGAFQVMLVSDVAARGLDLPQIDVVVNIELPSNAAHYAHRAGRTGRMGAPGMVLTLIAPGERFVVERLSKRLGVPILECHLAAGELVVGPPAAKDTKKRKAPTRSDDTEPQQQEQAALAESARGSSASDSSQASAGRTAAASRSAAVQGSAGPAAGRGAGAEGDDDDFILDEDDEVDVEGDESLDAYKQREAALMAIAAIEADERARKGKSKLPAALGSVKAVIMDEAEAGGAQQQQDGVSEGNSNNELSFVCTQEQLIASKVVEQRRKLPPVLNDKALFTKAAPFGDRADQSYHGPSNRIGVYYSPCSMAAAAMLLEEVPQDPHGPRTRAPGTSPRQLNDIRSSYSSSRPLSPSHTGSSCSAAAGAASACRTPSPARGSPRALVAKPAVTGARSIDEAGLVDALMRYHYYICYGIDPRQVAPFREEWQEDVLLRVPSLPPAYVSRSFYDAFLKDALDEVRADYLTAMQKSMLDYVLANPHERQRLALEGLEPLLAARWAGGPLGPPVLSPFHQAVVRRHLPKDWRDHVALAREDIAWTLQTLSPNALELSKLWYDCGYATARLLDVSTPELLDHLPVKGNQLRGLVASSLHDYMEFFRQHKAVKPVDLQQDIQMWSCQPVFETVMVAAEGIAVMGLPRISPATISSNSLAAPPSASSVGALAHSSSVIPVADLSEDLIQDAVTELLSIMQANTSAPQQLAALFEPFLYLLQLDPAGQANTFAVGAGGLEMPDLSLFNAEVERLRTAQQAIHLVCTDFVRTGEPQTEGSGWFA